MKKKLFGLMLLLLLVGIPFITEAQVNVRVAVGLPPAISFGSPPEVVVLPDTNGVYAVPDLDIDLYFWNGWWWRNWKNRWYRSRYYDHGWVYYRYVPDFYYYVDPAWRIYYRDKSWYGHNWHHELIAHDQLQRNWRRWERDRHWEKGRMWNVQDYRPRPQEQRHHQYQPRSQAGPQPRPQTGPQVQPQPRPQPGPQPNPRMQPQLKPQAGPQPRPQAGPQVQPQPRPQPGPQPPINTHNKHLQRKPPREAGDHKI